MSPWKKFSIVLGVFLAPYVYASSFEGPKPEPKVIAEECRQLALKIDWLGRYQDREACTRNLDGLSVYMASQYILEKKNSDAKSLLTRALYQINFAIDINCYGQDEMKRVVESLKEIIDDI